MKILTYDIETAPKLGLLWRVWKQNLSPNQLLEDGYILSWAAKWLGSDEVIFDSVFNYSNKPEDEAHLARGLHSLFEEADAIVTYNGNKFDIPLTNKSFIQAGLGPPSDYKSLDLYKTVRSKFNWTYNRLDFVCQELGLGNKVEHEGMPLWISCMNGDKDAWQRMEDYNKEDVRLTERLYVHLRPWIRGHPNVNLYSDSKADSIRCPSCGSAHVVKRGAEVLAVGRYQAYHCKALVEDNKGEVIPCNRRFRGRTLLNSPAERKLLGS